ncbi:type II and III secretion system protein family protein [Desertibaculum subflavum]|uniref:type II and III secretion system protein family protein n=1 Tax=Desertibaculum subflavum TaxID=2268458 RepID=UPI000E6662F2
MKTPLLRLLGGITAGLVLAHAAAAQTVVRPEQAAPAQPIEVVASGGNKLAIEVSRGQLIKLNRPAAAVFVADPAVAEVSVKSPTLVYVFGKKAGDTTLYAVDERERVLLDLRLLVTHDLTRLNEQLRQTVPDAEVSATSVQGGIVLQGLVPNAGQAEDVQRIAQRFLAKDEQIINRITLTDSNQINLRVRIVEVSRDLVKRIGFNIDALTSGKFAFGIATGAATTVGAFPGSAIATRTAGVNNIVGTGRVLGVDLNTVIDAMETEGLATILAEPNLTAVSGETASFLAGGEFPIPVPQDNTTITIQFKKFGVSLNFIPTILSGGRIALKVAPEVSQLSESGAIVLDGFSIPSLTTRRAETSVELASGQSLAIAGLIQNNMRTDAQKVPGLGDIPILGALFRSNGFRRNETELVIIVTPYLVRPVMPTAKLSTPVDGLIPANDVDRAVRGKVYREQIGPGPSRAAGPTANGLIGPAGFVLD